VFVQYLFYQNVRDQLADVLECLGEKAPIVQVRASILLMFCASPS
jgi:hypothetical protein